MKKFYVACIIGLCALALISCGAGKPSDVIKDMQSAVKSENIEDVYKYYTKGTADAIKEMHKLFPDAAKEKDSKFAEGAKWEVIEEKIDGDIATVKIKYTEHPVENMKGFEFPFRMKKEEGKWKIDMEKEMQQALAMIKAMQRIPGVMDQMKKRMKK